MTPAQIDAVIAGLTRAQREAVVAASIRFGDHLNRVRSIAPRGTVRALVYRGLASDEYTGRLTPLGLAVRQRLVEMGEGV